MSDAKYSEFGNGKSSGTADSQRWDHALITKEIWNFGKNQGAELFSNHS